MPYLVNDGDEKVERTSDLCFCFSQVELNSAFLKINLLDSYKLLQILTYIFSVLFP